MTNAPEKTNDEAAIEALVDLLAWAIRAKDIEAVMSVFAPEVVSFDLGPPLEHGGGAAFEARWQELFDSYAGRVDYEFRDLVVTAGHDVASVPADLHERKALLDLAP